MSEVSVELGNNAEFKNNTAAVNGGAIAVFGATGTTANNDKGLSIGSGALFENNTANQKGGAIFASDAYGHTSEVTINGKTEFKGNKYIDNLVDFVKSSKRGCTLRFKVAYHGQMEEDGDDN